MHCPECGKEIFETWNVCPYCGKNLKLSDINRENISNTILSYENWWKENDIRDYWFLHYDAWAFTGGFIFGFIIIANIIFFDDPIFDNSILNLVINILSIIISITIYISGFINIYRVDTKNHNKYYLYVVDSLLRGENYIDAVIYCLKLTRTGIPEYQYKTTIAAVIEQCEKAGDEYRANLLKQKLEK